MPEMKFLTEEPKIHWSAHLAAVMLYPDDEHKRKELLTVLFAKNYLAKIQDRPIPPDVLALKPKLCGCLKWEEWSQELLDIVVTLVDAPPYEKIFNQTENNKGMIAGERLYWIAVTENSNLGGSAAKVEDMLSNNPPVTIHGKPLHCSERTSRTAWKRFMPVAHLHCAMRAYPALFKTKDDPLNSPYRLLQVSEFFRRFGEQFSPGNLNKPVLDPSKTWKLPQGFPIKEIAFELPKLNESGRAAVADYLSSWRSLKEANQL